MVVNHASGDIALFREILNRVGENGRGAVGEEIDALKVFFFGEGERSVCGCGNGANYVECASRGCTSLAVVLGGFFFLDVR